MSLMMSQPRVETGGVVVATAAFDPPVISIGQSCIYRVTFNALEQSIDFLEQDELLEITPISLRLRKKNLSGIENKRGRQD